jgi:hypothetical protein
MVLPYHPDGCMLSCQNLLDTAGHLDASLARPDGNKGFDFC